MSYNPIRVSVERNVGFAIKLGDLLTFCSHETTSEDEQVLVSSIDPLTLRFDYAGIETGYFEGPVNESNHLVLKEIGWTGIGSGVEFPDLLEFLGQFSGLLCLKVVWEDGGVEIVYIENGRYTRSRL